MTLSSALWRPTSSRADDPPRVREQAGGVQPSRALERRLGKTLGQVGEQGPRQLRAGRKHGGVDRDLLERALAADAAG